MSLNNVFYYNGLLDDLLDFSLYYVLNGGFYYPLNGVVDYLLYNNIPLQIPLDWFFDQNLIRFLYYNLFYYWSLY